MKNKRIAYRRYRFRYWIDLIMQGKFHKDYKGLNKIAGKRIPSDEQANQILIDAINSNEPFCLLRPGNVEYEFAVMHDYDTLYGGKTYESSKIFDILDKDDDRANRWATQFKEDLKEADVIACFGRKAYSEYYLMEVYSSPDYVIEMRQLECIHLSHPWTLELKNKKVLIVSPFSETMKEQYGKRNLIWNGKKILPDMDVTFIKSVWYLDKDNNDGFDDWFVALEYLDKQIKETDFDIALLGCGPFSTFLAANIKRSGKKAIQYGGALQMLFGIQGARWDGKEYYKPFVNEHWVRPSSEETPKGKNRMDGGCYW